MWNWNLQKKVLQSFEILIKPTSFAGKYWHILLVCCKDFYIHILFLTSKSLLGEDGSVLKSFLEKKTLRLLFCQGETNFAIFHPLQKDTNNPYLQEEKQIFQMHLSKFWLLFYQGETNFTIFRYSVQTFSIFSFRYMFCYTTALYLFS